MTKEIPKLFKDKSQCCACGACMNICPVEAIRMGEDEYGFMYPEIDESICIGCKKCKNVCAFQNIEVKNEPIETYAAVARDGEVLKKSASGGVFATLAQLVIKNGGVAVGAKLQRDFKVEHIIIDRQEDISSLQGSKYSQSYIGWVYKKVQDHLTEDRFVLFSGTPCQVAGLYGYLGRDYEKLLTIDIVCHGVPGNKMFQDYIESIEEKFGASVANFNFRDKTMGWGIKGSFIVNGVKKKIWESSSSYLYYFAKGWIYRENCYLCKYACKARPADVTLGDYWGIEKQHPEYIGKNKWDENQGISLVIANTEKGDSFLSKVEDTIEFKESDFMKAAAGNGQLQHPSYKGNNTEIMDIYRVGGWKKLEKYFHNNIGWRRYSSQIKSLLPGGFKRKLKALR